MTLQIPDNARFTMRGALADRIFRFWPMRNAPDHPTRVVARASIRQLVNLIRQISQP